METSKTVTSPLALHEELFLLAVDETKGDLMAMHTTTFKVAFTAAILMNLALENKIDSDLSKLLLGDMSPTGDSLLDTVIDEIKTYHKDQNVQYWLERITKNGETHINTALTTLIRKGHLEVKVNKLLGVFSNRKYPIVNDQEVRKIRSHLRNLIFSNDIPDPRDLTLVSLLFYSSLLDLILTDEEIDDQIARIEQLSKMDLIGQSMRQTLEEFTMMQYVKDKIKYVFGEKTAEQKLQKKVRNTMKRNKWVSADQLPLWLREGTEEYKMTLAFVEKIGTADILYNEETQKYVVKRYT